VSWYRLRPASDFLGNFQPVSLHHIVILSRPPLSGMVAGHERLGR